MTKIGGYAEAVLESQDWRSIKQVEVCEAEGYIRGDDGKYAAYSVYACVGLDEHGHEIAVCIGDFDKKEDALLYADDIAWKTESRVVDRLSEKIFRTNFDNMTDSGWASWLACLTGMELFCLNKKDPDLDFVIN